jgi:hypothetical protein
MTGLHRATPHDQVLALARRLAEDYPTVPLPEVSRAVQAAADACADELADIERQARQSLRTIVRRPGGRSSGASGGPAASTSSQRVKRARDARARSAAGRGGPRPDAGSHG